MKKNKGFTLIELLAVIVILGILIAFSTIAISKQKKKQDEKNYRNAISTILTGAKTYIAEHPEALVFGEGDGVTLCSGVGYVENIACTAYNTFTGEYVVRISVVKLQEQGYIDISDEKFLSLLYDKYNEGQTGDNSRHVEISVCPYNNLKLKYRLNDMRKTAEKKYYNDCGCEEQPDTTISDLTSKELCEE